MIQWAVTLGHIDIMCTVMTRGGGCYRCQPRIGHLDRLKRIFGFLKSYKSCSIKFRTEELGYSALKSKNYDWTNLYGNIQEELPNNMPKAKGRKVMLTCFADANLYHDRLTGRLVTGLFLMLNRTPIDWFSKKQVIVESAIKYNC